MALLEEMMSKIDFDETKVDKKIKFIEAESIEDYIKWLKDNNHFSDKSLLSNGIRALIEYLIEMYGGFPDNLTCQRFAQLPRHSFVNTSNWYEVKLDFKNKNIKSDAHVVWYVLSECSGKWCNREVGIFYFELEEDAVAVKIYFDVVE